MSSGKSEEPLVSVLVLTYNHLNFFNQAIESIVSQKTNFSYEILIGDDCSTDGTSILVDEFKNKYPSLINVLRPKKNIGQQANLINIINNCKGKYIAFIESDDYWIDQDKLQKQVNFMELNPEFSLCFTNSRVEFFNFDGTPYLLNENLNKDIFTIEDLISENEIWFMATASLFFRKSSIYPTKEWLLYTKSGDIPLIIIAAKSGKIKYLPDVTAVYRKHPLGTSQTDHKYDSNFLKSRIFMYRSLDKETDYKFHDIFKKNLSHWYFLLINSKQYKNSYLKRLKYIIIYLGLNVPNKTYFNEILKTNLLPNKAYLILRKIKHILTLI